MKKRKEKKRKEKKMISWGIDKHNQPSQEYNKPINNNRKKKKKRKARAKRKKSRNWFLLLFRRKKTKKTGEYNTGKELSERIIQINAYFNYQN